MADAKPDKPWKVIIDTGAVLQAALNPNGPASRLLDLMDAGEITVYISPAIRAEYEDVLSRVNLRQKFPQLTDQRMEATLPGFDEAAVFIHPVPYRIRFERDPNDEPILNLAVHVGAAYIIARDKDLLDLGDSLRGVKVMNPVAFLAAGSVEG